jgi:hypothetical protein
MIPTVMRLLAAMSRAVCRTVRQRLAGRAGMQ